MPKCNRLGCLKKAVGYGRCEYHLSSTPTTTTRVRPSYHSLYNTLWWSKARRSILRDYPLCMRCKSYGYSKGATDVDHIVSHKGNEELFYDMNNLQTLCHECHSWKTQKEGVMPPGSLSWRKL